MLQALLVNQRNATILSEVVKRLPAQIMMKIASLIFRCIMTLFLFFFCCIFWLLENCFSGTNPVFFCK